MTTTTLEALTRATSGQSVANYAAIFAGFTAKGLRESEIIPRVNVLTFNAWKAKGRSVRKGEHGVKVFTFIEIKDHDGTTKSRRPRSVTVFHESQTELTADRQASAHYPDPGELAADRWNETHC